MSEFAFSNLDSARPDGSINVMFYYDGAEQYAHPIEVSWQGQSYRLGSVEFWYTERHQDGFAHHYTVPTDDGELVFKLRLETKNLVWTLEAVESSIVTVAERPVREVDFGWVSFKKPEAQYA